MNRTCDVANIFCFTESQWRTPVTIGRSEEIDSIHDKIAHYLPTHSWTLSTILIESTCSVFNETLEACAESEKFRTDFNR
jgi:hypothetical protein